MENKNSVWTQKDILITLVVAFGYFVDLYDLLLFSAVRQASLIGIQVPEGQLLSVGLKLLNWQLFGLLLGGLVFGVIADKKGRLSVLFASILTYSLANIANAFVTDVYMYSFLRFMAGLGLAGELGIGITLVSENLSNNKRTIATVIISSIGLLGAVTAAFVASKFNWQVSYIIGGIMGLVLLAFRYRMKESSLFKEISENRAIKKGNLLVLFSNKRLMKTFLICMLAGAPIFVYIGLFITFAPEFGKQFGIIEKVTAHDAIVYFYISLVFSDILCGLISRWLRSRKIPLLIFAGIQILAVCAFIFFPPTTAEELNHRYILLGIGSGFWGILVVNATEQFGTNLRATVTASVPNLVRALAIPAIFLFQFLQPSYSYLTSAAIVSLSFIAISIVSIALLKDNFENELSFNEK